MNSHESVAAFPGALRANTTLRTLQFESTQWQIHEVQAYVSAIRFGNKTLEKFSLTPEDRLGREQAVELQLLAPYLTRNRQYNTVMDGSRKLLWKESPPIALFPLVVQQLVAVSAKPEWVAHAITPKWLFSFLCDSVGHGTLWAYTHR